MTTEYSLRPMELTQGGLMQQLRDHGGTWTGWGAASGLCLGILSPIFGSILTIITWLTGPDWHGLHLHRDCTVLFVLTFPLLAFGAHCLDLLDRQENKARKSGSN